jgi:predicted naringenin-chalcone synthase
MNKISENLEVIAKHISEELVQIYFQTPGGSSLIARVHQSLTLATKRKHALQDSSVLDIPARH